MAPTGGAQSFIGARLRVIKGEPLRGTRVIHCSCCGLEQPALLDADAAGYPFARCVRCNAHQGDTLEIIARREGDHAQLYKHALIDAQDDTVLAQSERDFCRDKMQAAYDTRELLVKILSAVDDTHHYRGNRCVCGKRNCKVVELLADPRVARLIHSYDEERRTLRELRNANPELWADAWDCIDVTIVYPPRERRAGGRHRAAG